MVLQTKTNARYNTSKYISETVYNIYIYIYIYIYITENNKLFADVLLAIAQDIVMNFRYTKRIFKTFCLKDAFNYYIK